MQLRVHVRIDLSLIHISQDVYSRNTTMTQEYVLSPGCQDKLLGHEPQLPHAFGCFVLHINVSLLVQYFIIYRTQSHLILILV